jgi:HTH-type transcriptional regulator/antitoxin HigA
MKQVNIIHTHEEHQTALARASKLMDLDSAPGSPEADELDLLFLVIGKYEKEHFPRNPVDPIDVIKFMMDQQNLKKKDLIPYIGSASKVTEVLNGTRSLSLNMIRRLSEGLGIPASTLIQPTVRKRA